MPRVRSPKKGSLAFSPRKRASDIKGRIDYWPEVEEGPQLLGFAGYKAGMTHIYYVEDRDRVPEYGQEIQSAVTVIDAPPMLICGIRAYRRTYKGLEVMTEAWMKDPPKDVFRQVFQREANPEKVFELLDKNIEDIAEIRAITSTQPRLAALPKKTPDIMEIPIKGGEKEEQLDYAKELLGNHVKIQDIFQPGEALDIVGITKGKGFQGPVKRWGIRILQHKSRKTKRGVASIGPWVPRRVMPQVPRAGQMGFHQRTEYNKRIMLMGEDGENVTPKEGFHRYGEVNGDFLLLKGSVMGAKKRLIKFRKGVRESRYPKEEPKITYIHANWKKRNE